MFRGTTKGDFEDHADFDGPLTGQIDGAFHFVKRNLRVRSQLVEENTGRKDTYELPLASVREAICNAAFHRNYLEPSNVYVALYDDRLEIVSPGRLLKEISIEEVRLGYSKIRNKGLADALVYMHEVESWGGGVARYYSAMKEAGLPPPVAEERNGFFTVVFRRPNKGASRPEKVSIGPEKVSIDALKESVGSDAFSAPTWGHIDVIAQRLSQLECFRKGDVVKVVRLKSSAVTMLLRKMIDKGILVPVSGHGKGAYRFA